MDLNALQNYNGADPFAHNTSTSDSNFSLL